MTESEIVADWYERAGGEENFGRQLYYLEFPGVTNFHKSLVEGLLYYIGEHGCVFLNDIATETGWPTAKINDAASLWRDLGVLDFADSPVGRQFLLLKSPLDVRFQLVVQVDGKTVLNTTDVPTIEKLGCEKGRGTVRGKDQA